MNRQQRRANEKQNRKNHKPMLESLLPRAINLHRSGKLEEAERIYRDILHAAPEQPDACHFLGILLHQKGKSQAGIALIKRAIDAVPDYADACNNLGNVYKETGDLEQAAAMYRKVIDFAPNHPDPLNNLAIVLKDQGELDEALARILRAIELATDRAEFFHTLGNIHRKRGDFQLSAEACRKSILLQPYQADAYKSLWRTLYVAGELAEAAKVLEQWLEFDPENPIAKHTYAAFSGGDHVPDRAADDYVQQTFDSFAATFDKVLERLDYRAPELVTGIVAEIYGPSRKDLFVLDAGCGTGLCGPLIRAFSARTIGVDLSAKMLTRAEARGVYDELVEAELVAYIQSRPTTFDLIISADVLVYFGDLQPFMHAAKKALSPDGRLVFTVEKSPLDQGYQLNVHGRYSHSRHYVEQSLLEAGMNVHAIRDEILRKEWGKPVDGLLISAQI